LEYNQSIGGNEERQLLVQEALSKLGLATREATIYIFLLKKGPHSANSITKIMRLNKVIVYRILKHLRANGFIVSTLSFPASFSAVPLNLVLDNVAKAKKREATFLLKDKKILCDAMKSFDIEDAPVIDDEIAILRNRHFALAKGEKLIKQTTTESLVAADGLIKLDYDMVGGLQKDIIPPVRRNNAKFRFLTRIDYSGLAAAKEMVARIEPYKENIKVRHLEIDHDMFPHFQICDEKAILVQFDVSKGLDPKNVSAAGKFMWTTNKTIIRYHKMLYDRLWNESIDIRDRIAQLESEKKDSR
jgi:hypothetical protein